jgi:transcriptional regulatory protein LevR
MIKKAILLMCFAGVGVNAQTITQTFGSGANSFSMDFVQIGPLGMRRIQQEVRNLQEQFPTFII